MQGTIIKGIAGFYYIHVQEYGILECKAKGIFRQKAMKPLVGDKVKISWAEEDNQKGIIDEILPRKNVLIRPSVANVDQALVVFSIVKPVPNYNLLDRFLIMMKQLNIPVIICFNKKDLVNEAEWNRIRSNYQGACEQVLFTSTVTEEGIQELKDSLKGKTTTIAGPSGVGKSSIINLLQHNTIMEIGEISTKIHRGKHTTRHSELLTINQESYIMDTPGFSSLDLFHLEKEELAQYYDEFQVYEPQCKFQGCSHIHEPSCGVRDAVEEGNIPKVRYENYTILYKELQEKRRY